MSDTDTNVAHLWRSAVAVVPSDPTTLAPLFGRNFRLNLKAALTAVWHSIRTVLGTTKAIAEHGSNPLSWMEVTTDAAAAVAAVLEAVQEEMKPLAYVAAIVLSSDPDGLTEEEFETRLGDFLSQESYAHLPWYLALTPGRIAGARRARQDTDVASLVATMVENRQCEMSGGRLKVRDRWFTWGFSG